jgi:hypothetical protein
MVYWGNRKKRVVRGEEQVAQPPEENRQVTFFRTRVDSGERPGSAINVDKYQELLGLDVTTIKCVGYL